MLNGRWRGIATDTESFYPQITQITQIISWLVLELIPMRYTSPQYAANLQNP